ncbi:MAG: biotin--[acetyl-CoA-carboxylase] ligase [Deltaproteobacteria bacterium]|nr:biotin--[acetyl-CoA-carboxylase] ligase [Deltaproteobacteria bacterium]
MQAKEAAEVEIIRLLKAGKDSYISGQALSAALGVSRTAVWKHIEKAREMGFSIEALPSKGYRLNTSADAPFNGIEVSSGLETGFIGRNICFYPSLDSTNMKAFELGRQGAPEGTAVIADSQTGGKGRLGRRWESPAGANLYTSIILRPGIPPRHAHNLTFLSAVAVAETVERFSPVRPTVKWPNDILLDGKKVAGILMEMDSEPDRVHFVVAGIGVNINIKVTAFPDRLRPMATSLYEKSGKETNRAVFTCVLYSSLEKWYKVYREKGFLPLMEAWKGFFASVGKTVTVRSFDSVIEGVCLGVDDDDGALLVKTRAGAIERVVSGDVEIKRDGL